SKLSSQSKGLRRDNHIDPLTTYETTTTSANRAEEKDATSGEQRQEKADDDEEPTAARSRSCRSWCRCQGLVTSENVGPKKVRCDCSYRDTNRPPLSLVRS